MTDRELFIQAVRECHDLPEDVRALAESTPTVSKSCFDESYLEFLAEQIELSPRGPEWTEILRRRRDALRPFCGIPLLAGRVETGRFSTSIRVDPNRRAVIQWETLELEFPP